MADGYVDILTAATEVSEASDSGAGTLTSYEIRIDALVDSGETLNDRLGGHGSRLQMMVQSDGTMKNRNYDGVSTDTNSTAAIGSFSYGTRYQFRCIYTASTTIQFYYKTDTAAAITSDTGWTQLGSDVSHSQGNALPTTDAWSGGGITTQTNRRFIGELYQQAFYENGTLQDYCDFRSGDWSDLDTGHNSAQSNSFIATGTETTDWNYVAATALQITPTLVNQTATTFAPTFSFSQSARPASDITTTGWTASTGSDLYAMLDEATPSDTDYITATAT